MGIGNSEPLRRLTAFPTGLRQTDPQLYERVDSHHLGGFVAASLADCAAALAIVRMFSTRPVR